MEDPSTLVLNLTFLGTVGVAFLMFFVLFLLGAITLVLAGIGRLVAVLLLALFGWRFRKESIPLVRLYGTPLQPSGKAYDAGAAATASRPVQSGLPRAKPSKPSKPKRKPRDWRAALKPANLRSALRDAVVHHPALAAARKKPAVLSKDWAAAVAEADARAMARARAAAPEIKLSIRDLPDPLVPAEKVVKVAPLVESALDDHQPAREPRSFKKPQPPHPLSPLDTGSLVSLAAPAQVLKGRAGNGTESKGSGTKSSTTKGSGTKSPGPKGKQPLP